MRIYLDANVLFSAAKSDGAVRLLLTLLGESGQELCADGYVVEEARRNLSAKAPRREDELDRILRDVDVSLVHSGDAENIAVLSLPAKDRPMLAAAIRLGCGALVTGDKTHFRAFYGKTIRGVAIHTPRSLAETLLRLT